MKAAPEQPLVSVVTPVYNGADYLAQCIESVIAQTYDNWEYVIVNNCSTDATLDIATKYADRDSRIRIHSNAEFMPLLANSNHALRQMSPGSKYCKILHADDWLFPNCLREMVAVAEAHSRVAIVSAYRLEETRVSLDGLPYPSTVVAGRDIGRRYLLDGTYLFGSPTSTMIRTDLVRQREMFYDEEHVHSDVEVCLELLRSGDFGFVHQVLTFTRRHNESNTSFSKRLRTNFPDALYIIQKHGRHYLGEWEYEQVVRKRLKAYYRFLGTSVLRLRKSEFRARWPEFWGFHTKALRDLGYPISYARVAGGAAAVLYNAVLDKLHIV